MIRVFFLLYILFYWSNVHFLHAFEPVQIDEFFKKYADDDIKDTIKKPEQQPIAPPSRPLEPLTPSLEKADHKKIKTNQFSQIQFLMINRISGKKDTILIPVGKKKALNGFTILSNGCQQNIYKNNARYTLAEFQVYEDFISTDQKTNKKKMTQKMIYANSIYIEMPGLNGFEHSVYDIRPIKCMNAS